MALASDTGMMWFLFGPPATPRSRRSKAITTDELQKLINCQTKR